MNYHDSHLDTFGKGSIAFFTRWEQECVCVYKLHQEPLQIPGSCHGYWGPVYTADMNRQRSSVCVCICVCGCLTLWRSWPGCHRSCSWPRRRPPCRAGSSFHPSSQPSYPQRELLNCSCPTTSWPAWEDTGGVSLKILQEHDGIRTRSSGDTSNHQFQTAFFSVSTSFIDVNVNA